jgi:hypothetical protein
VIAREGDRFLGLGPKTMMAVLRLVVWGTKGMSGMVRIVVREGETKGKVCVLTMKCLF